MNKKLLTAVVGAALVVGPMVASAAGPTVFGNLHLSLDRIENDGGLEQGFVSSNNSDFGIRGDDELGGGLKAVYQVQSGAFSADTGTGGFSGTLQDTFAGLSGGFGTLRIGRMDTPYKLLRPVVDGFGTRVGDARNLIGGTGVALMAFDARISNSIRYDSPSLGGFVVSAHWGSGEAGAFSSTNSDVGSVGLTWSAGPLTVGAAYEKHSTATDDEETGVRVVGRFTFGPAAIGAFIEKLTDLSGVAGTDRQNIGLTGWYKFGNSTVRAQFFQADELDNAADTGGKLIALGFDHALSKTTTLYAIYAVADNDPASTFKVSGAGSHGDSLAAVAGMEQTGMSAGLQVKF